jgi:hypothetical protein
MFHEPLRTFAIRSPALLIVSFVASIGFLIACQVTMRALVVFSRPTAPLASVHRPAIPIQWDIKSCTRTISPAS